MRLEKVGGGAGVAPSFGDLGLGQVQFVFLELPKYGAGEQPQSMQDRWAHFLSKAELLRQVPPVLAEEPFAQVL